MRAKAALYLVGVSLLSPGCELAYLAGRDLAYEVSRNTDNLVSCIHYRELAKEAWNECQAANPEATYSVHYVQGFKDGYVDLLTFGGSGEPPILPPRRYWKVTYQTPEGNQAIQDWFAGFRQGAAAARASGNRQLITVPTSQGVPGGVPPPLAGLPLGPMPQEGIQAPAPSPSPRPMDELLPPPRQLPAP
jgi:hypothetical protein